MQPNNLASDLAPQGKASEKVKVRRHACHVPLFS